GLLALLAALGRRNVGELQLLQAGVCQPGGKGLVLQARRGLQAARAGAEHAGGDDGEERQGHQHSQQGDATGGSQRGFSCCSAGSAKPSLTRVSTGAPRSRPPARRRVKGVSSPLERISSCGGLEPDLSFSPLALGRAMSWSSTSMLSWTQSGSSWALASSGSQRDFSGSKRSTR